MNECEVIVGIGEYKAARPPYRIMTIGLGSCVGIALYDRTNRIGGLAHIMLPSVSSFKNAGNTGRFADVAIPLLIESMEFMGASRRYITAKIGGGANMFSFPDSSLTMDIGSRNVEMVRSVLSKLSIRISGEAVGGKMGRTMILETDSGKTYIKTVDRVIREI